MIPEHGRLHLCCLSDFWPYIPRGVYIYIYDIIYVYSVYIYMYIHTYIYIMYMFLISTDLQITNIPNHYSHGTLRCDYVIAGYIAIKSCAVGYSEIPEGMQVLAFGLRGPSSSCLRSSNAPKQNPPPPPPPPGFLFLFW